MDDGKCLLDVISDPQALKEFFRSTSQIAFVEGDASPVKDDNVSKQQNKDGSVRDVIRNDVLSYSSSSQAASIQSNSGIVSGGLLQQQQTKPLVHFSYSTASDLNLCTSPFMSRNVSSPVTNGIPANVNSSTGHVPYSTRSEPGGSAFTTSVKQTSPKLQNAVSAAQSMPSLSVGKEPVPPARTSFVNTPISFAFGDANKARNLLSGGTQVVSSLEKPAVVQQAMGHSVELKASPTKLASNIVPGIGTQNRTTNVKGSQLPPLRPKKIVPRPLTQKNTATAITGDLHNTQVGMQGGLLTQGIKGKVVGCTKGQPLIAIQPKLVITSQTNVASGGLGNQNTLTVGKTSQTLGSNLTIGAKLQAPLQNQILNSLTVQQPKSSIQNASQVTQSKVSLTNFAQLQPKQIAPKPNQSVGYSVTGKPAMSHEHSQLQQQLVQSLLAQAKQNQSQQFTAQTSTGTMQKGEKLGDSTDKQQNLAQQQDLKELLQRNQMLQQVFQVQRGQQPQNSTPVTNVQANATAEPSHIGTNVINQYAKPTSSGVISQSSPLQSLINSTLVGQGQLKLQQSVGQPTNSVNVTTSLTGQMKSAVNTKQLQKFLEKNPVLAQQLKQINLKQSNITGNITNTSTASSVKNVVQLQNPGKTPVTTVSQVPTAGTKKLMVATSGAQPQPLVINQAQRMDQKAAVPQKVLIVQQSNAGAAATTVGQPRVLLQTKEGRPILLSQEQFKQIQQQLASKNLSIQGKLVTATTKPQVVLKPSEASSTKDSPKVVSSATTQKTQVKQEITKGIKRQVKPAETEESKLIKRMKAAVQKDQNSVSYPDIHKPFKIHKEAIKNLVPFHVFSEPEPNAEMQQKANVLLDKLSMQLINKSDRMINKYRQLLLGDMQRNVSSAELVMVNRIFLADEKAALMKEKKTVLEEAQNMAQSIGANSSQMTAVKQEDNSVSADGSSAAKDTGDLSLGKNGLPLSLLPNSTIAPLNEDLTSPRNTSEQQVDITDVSPSPITSANSFLLQLSATNTKLSLSERTSDITAEPS